ncbi:MAG: PhzF family phenazine biosynthesis isomerase [Succinivibrionaceae bacterium]|nr:PhzF family phenazine biosynthesis isomerase [Succinivibrionaceae bacterium]
MKQFIVDTFTQEIFKGNPAAVCILDSKLPEEIMLKIAQENNLSETAFAIKNGDYYDLRWFTPKAEIELCGHATLATSFILKNFYEPKANTFKFKTLSGILSVSTQDNLLSMDFPTIEIKEISQNPEFKKAIGKNVSEAYLGADLILVLI